jgi:hypothetical protein
MANMGNDELGVVPSMLVSQPPQPRGLFEVGERLYLKGWISWISWRVSAGGDLTWLPFPVLALAERVP